MSKPHVECKTLLYKFSRNKIKSKMIRINESKTTKKVLSLQVYVVVPQTKWNYKNYTSIIF